MFNTILVDQQRAIHSLVMPILERIAIVDLTKDEAARYLRPNISPTGSPLAQQAAQYLFGRVS